MKKLVSLVMVGLVFTSLVGCAKEKTYTVEEVINAIKNSGVQAPQVMTTEDDANKDIIVQSTYKQFGDEKILDLVDSYYIERPMMSFGTWEIHVLKAKPGKAKEVEAALKTYGKNVVEKGMLYPSMVVDYNNAKVTVLGDIVVFTAIGEEMDNQDAGKTPNLDKVTAALDALKDKK